MHRDGEGASVTRNDVSNVAIKGDYDSQKNAAVTLDELERWSVHAITGIYHREVHRALGTTPLAAWDRGISGDATSLDAASPLQYPTPIGF